MAVWEPSLFDQLFWEATSAAESAAPSWRRPGETARQARDRLRAEREAAKARAA
ncbi:hypothetical protein [uncultured Parolsenella sp.]|uniref:hypothetical protein n=1 Tax=uncultured Parolsenella sp. TaxID=2083008 RepID=UPI0027D9384F|nr:hypothetical protein [uncultured Parolsenella sp.]